MNDTLDNDADKIHLFNIPSGDESEEEHLEISVNNFCSWYLVSGGPARDRDELVEIFMVEFGADENQRSKVFRLVSQRV